jgi:hypothetical protein
MKALTFCLALLLYQSNVRADLLWERKELEFTPSGTDTSVTAEFSFTNTGPNAVTLASVKPDCGCTTAALDKMTYQPGEKGRITAVFTFGQRTGLQKKLIHVSLTEGQDRETTLSIIAHIPETVKITPQFVFWQVGETPGPKTIEFKVLRDAPLPVTKVTSSDSSIKVALETVQEGRAYKIVVTPVQTKTLARASLIVETEDAPHGRQFFTAYAHIKPSDSQRPKILVYKNGQLTPSETKSENKPSP